MIVLKIILWIIAVAAVVGILAGVADLGKKNGDHKPYGPYERFIKRPFDAFLATGALIVLSPVLLILIVLGAIKMKGNPFFTQARPGRDEKIFKLIKFRTMTNAKDKNGNLLPDVQRNSKYGDALRKTSLDELPELFNILKGDMSIIGPRPLLVRYLPYYTEEEHHRHDVRPGLTGWAQVNGRNFITWEETFKLDLEYVENVSFAFDVRTIIMTVKKVISHADITDATQGTEDSSGRKVHDALDIERGARK